MQAERIEAQCWFNGEILPARAAALPVLDHGLLYGDGVFEGIRCYGGRPFRLAEHLRRLERSARALALALPLDAAQFGAAIAALLQRFGAGDAYLRLVVTRGVGALGIDPRRCTRPNVFIIADQLELIDADARARGASVIVAATRRLGADGLDPRIKSLNYLNHILARMEANHAGADEAILLNAAGRVAEGSADNVFVVRAGALATPPVSEGALEGITRQVVLELAAQLGIEAAETPLATFDLYTADECFLTGTGAELIPVRQIDGRPLPACPGPVFAQLRTAFAALIERHARGDSDDC